MRKLRTERGGAKRLERDRAVRAGLFRQAALCGVLLAGVLAGCSKSGEAKITGSSSAPPVSLQCFWQAGYTYRLRLELTEVTDLERPEPNETTQHLVTFDQDYLIKVTDGARGGSLNLDMEILSLGMERANGGKKALSFDSAQGGETLDELGFIPVLKRLVGGHLRFQVSTNGNVLRADGISEWLDRALRSTNAVIVTGPVPILDGATGLELDPAVTPPPSIKIVRQAGKIVTTVNGAGSGNGGKVGSTLRSFFTQDHFKQMLEFPFLPPNPVRVGDVWSAQGETPISTRGRHHYEATCKFEGWQRQQGTNCARVAVEGKIAGFTGGNGPGAVAKPAGRPRSLTATLWVNTELQFPAIMILDKQILVPSESSSRQAGTNRTVTAGSLKLVQQHTATTLLSAAPTEKPAVAGDATVK